LLTTCYLIELDFIDNAVENYRTLVNKL